MSMSENETSYTPYNDLRLYPGIHLSEERCRQLDEDAVEPDELSTDDITYKLSRMVTGTMYGLLEVIEERWGKQAAREVTFEWARRRGRENLRRWMKERGAEHLTPELWARFQDYRHIISGPIHARSFISYEGDSDVVLNRTGCLFHDGRPEGMDSYSGTVADGKFVGYNEVCPEITSEHPICKGRGTSDSDHCQVRFSIRPQE